MQIIYILKEITKYQKAKQNPMRIKKKNQFVSIIVRCKYILIDLKLNLYCVRQSSKVKLHYHLKAIILFKKNIYNFVDFYLKYIVNV